VQLPPPRLARGHEQRGARYAVVLQSDALEPLSTTVLAPTSTAARGAPFRPQIAVAGERTRVLCEQIAAVSRERVGPVVGHLSSDELSAVEEAVAVILGLA
jgi:mRNA interferase MazF